MTEVGRSDSWERWRPYFRRCTSTTAPCMRTAAAVDALLLGCAFSRHIAISLMQQNVNSLFECRRLRRWERVGGQRGPLECDCVEEEGSIPPRVQLGSQSVCEECPQRGRKVSRCQLRLPYRWPLRHHIDVLPQVKLLQRAWFGPLCCKMAILRTAVLLALCAFAVRGAHLTFEEGWEHSSAEGWAGRFDVTPQGLKVGGAALE